VYSILLNIINNLIGDERVIPRPLKSRGIVAPDRRAPAAAPFGASEHVPLAFLTHPDHTYMFPFCSVPTRGAYRDRHGRGAECGGRGQRSRVGFDRRAGFSGLVSVSTARRRRRRSLRTAKAVWSWHPLLMLSPAEAPSGPTGRAVPSIRGMTVAKRNSSPGRARRKLLKPLRREGRLIRHTCGDYRVLPTTARGPRVLRAPGLPCALVVFEGQRS
jgi:hypothetical protein